MNVAKGSAARDPHVRPRVAREHGEVASGANIQKHRRPSAEKATWPMRPPLPLLPLLLLASQASSLIIAQAEDAADGTDSLGSSHRPAAALAAKKPGVRPSVLYAQTALAYAGATAVLMPIVETRHLAAITPGASGLLAFWSVLTALRDQYLFGFLCAHEVVNDLASDVLAQAFTVDRDKDLPKEQKRLVLDWRRVMRSMSSAMISDDLPFLMWSKLLWGFSEWAEVALRQSATLPARLVSALTHPLGMATVKMIITQLVYEPVSSAAYLSIQALLKGKGWKGARKELKDKMWTAWTDGLIYWSFAHMFVFMMPFWWLQPIADNVATLFFNSYLSMLSNS